MSHVYTIRFAVPVLTDTLFVRSSGTVAPIALRMRGPGILMQARVAAGGLIASPTPFEAYADRNGAPHSPRAASGPTDRSDGMPVDWPSFGGQHSLQLELERATVDTRLHVVLTVQAESPWPRAGVRYQSEDAWRTATVVDYNTRLGEWEITE